MSKLIAILSAPFMLGIIIGLGELVSLIPVK